MNNRRRQQEEAWGLLGAIGWPPLGLEEFGAASGELIPGGISYTLYDTFSTDFAAGFTSPRLSTPGPGALARSADTTNLGSITGGALVITGTAAVNLSDPAYYWTDTPGNSFGRAAGLTFIFRVFPTGIVNLGWSTATTVVNGSVVGIRSSGGAWSYTRLGNTHAIGTQTNGTEYYIALTLRADGIELRVKGGIYTTWSLPFVETNWNTTPLWPTVSGSGAFTANIPDVYIPASSGQLVASEILSVSSPNTTILTGRAATTIVLTATVPAGAVGRLIEVRYRQADANNYMLARVQWNGSNYEIVTGHVIAGVETLQGSPIASVVSATNVMRLEIAANGSSHDYFTTGGTTWAKRYTTITDSTGAANTGVSVNNDGFTSTSLLVWDYTDAGIASFLDAVIAG